MPPSEKSNDFGTLFRGSEQRVPPTLRQTKDSDAVTVRKIDDQVEHAMGLPARVLQNVTDLANYSVRNAPKVLEYGLLVPDWTTQRLGWAGRALRGGRARTYASMVPLTTGSYALEAFRKNVEEKNREIGEEFPRLASEHLIHVDQPWKSAERLGRALNKAAQDPQSMEDLIGVLWTHLPSDMIWGAGFQALQGSPAALRLFNQKMTESGFGEGYGKWLKRPKNRGRSMRKPYIDPISKEVMPLGDIPIGALSRGIKGAVTGKPTREAAGIWKEVTGVPPKFLTMIAQTKANLSIADMVNKFSRFIPTQVGRQLRANMVEMWDVAFEALERRAKEEGIAITGRKFIDSVTGAPVLKEVRARLQEQLEGGGKILKGRASELYETSRGYLEKTPYANRVIDSALLDDIFAYGKKLTRGQGATRKAGQKLDPYQAEEVAETAFGTTGGRWTVKNTDQLAAERPDIIPALIEAGLYKAGKEGKAGMGDMTWMRLDTLRRDLSPIVGRSPAGQRLQQMVTAKLEDLLPEFRKMALGEGKARSAQLIDHTERYYKKARKSYREISDAIGSDTTKAALRANPRANNTRFVDNIISGTIDPQVMEMTKRSLIASGGRDAWKQAKGMWWWSLVDEAAGVAGTDGGNAVINFNKFLNVWNDIRRNEDLQKILFDSTAEFKSAEKLAIALSMAQSSKIAQMSANGAFDSAALGTFGRVGMFAVSSLIVQGVHSGVVLGLAPAALVAATRAMSSPASVRIFAEGVRSAILHSEGIRTNNVIQAITKMGLLISVYLDEDDRVALRIELGGPSSDDAREFGSVTGSFENQISSTPDPGDEYDRIKEALGLN